MTRETITTKSNGQTLARTRSAFCIPHLARTETSTSSARA